MMQAMLKQLSTGPTNRRPIQPLTPLWVALIVWGGLVLLFAIQTRVTFATSWPDVLKQEYPFWLPWIFLLPAVVWTSLRFSFERPKIPCQIVVHLAVCTAILMINQLICRILLPLPPAPFDQHTPSPPELRIGPDVLIYLVTMSACVAFSHYRQSQERERRAIELEARLAQAKLQALRMQINPHFLFNTLNAISSLVHTDPRTADDMITDLSELFRGSLESSDNQEIPLSRELELLRSYLAIEQRRFGERLRIEQDVDPKILDALVPTLIFQPIVENAIRHGIEPQAAVGKIAVRVLRKDNRIKLSVSDNGKKPVDFSLVENISGRRGIGLANTRARLQQLYGKEQSLSIGQGELGGWTVEIILPFRPTRPAIS
jgi:two-component system, LytTR family, sensor kinase